jgi:DNA-binding CsgD family transcriptional regulator
LRQAHEPNVDVMNTMYAHHEVAALLRIAGEVGELAPDLHLRRAHILAGLLNLIGGCSAVCSEMNPRDASGSGWALPDRVTCAGALSADQQSLVSRYVTGNLAALDPCVPPLLRQDEPVLTVRRTDVVDSATWRRSDHFNEVRRPLGFGESVYAKLVTPDGRRLKLSFHRASGDRPFTSHHAQLVQVFNANLAAAYVVAPRSVEATTDRPETQEDPIDALPPRLRPVLRRLLAGDAEKQAASALGLSPHTVHEYTKSLYRSFGVNSRGELLSKFVANR